jgi:hypothetical protein
VSVCVCVCTQKVGRGSSREQDYKAEYRGVMTFINMFFYGTL